MEEETTMWMVFEEGTSRWGRRRTDAHGRVFEDEGNNNNNNNNNNNDNGRKLVLLVPTRWWKRRRTGGEFRNREKDEEEEEEGERSRHFSPSFRRETSGGVGGAGFRHHRDEGDSRGEDDGAWSMVPLILASSRSSSSTCSSSQISSYGGINVPYYGSLYLDFEGFGLSPSFRRIGGEQSSTKRRLRRLEERIALGINLDENGVPFDRELTEEQRERLFEYRAFKKELEQEDPFVENAEVLGLFLEYEEEKNVLLLGCGTSYSSSSSSLSGSPDTSTTTTVH